MMPTRVHKALHFAQDVRGEENGHAAGVLGADQVEELALHQRIEAGGRLIQEEQFGAVQQALHDADLFLVAIRQVADAAVQLQFHDFGQLVQALGAVAIVKAGGILEQVDDFHAFVVIDFRRQVADIAADLRTVGDHILAKNLGAAAGWMDQRQQQADGGGFAGAVRANEAEDFTFFFGERDIDDAA